jgi:hypothetical protein
MGRRRRKSTSEDLLDVLFDLTDIFWPIGAFVSTVLFFASFWTFDWAIDQYLRASVSHLLGSLIHSFGWVYFLLPLMTAVIAFIFGVKTYQSFSK